MPKRKTLLAVSGLVVLLKDGVVVLLKDGVSGAVIEQNRIDTTR